MVYVLPWDPGFNPNELRTRSVPIWVELSDVPPNCAAYGFAMLRSLGVLKTDMVETFRRTGQRRKQPQKPRPAKRELGRNRWRQRKRAKMEKEDFQTVHGKGKPAFKDPSFCIPTVIDNRFGVLQGEDDGEEDDIMWQIEEEEEQENRGVPGTLDEEIEEEEKSQPGHGADSNPLPRTGSQTGGLSKEGDVQMHEDNAENYTSFAEAERVNARPASSVEHEDKLHLSCASGNRLEFAEGRKKSRNLAGECEEGAEVCSARVWESRETKNRGLNNSWSDTNQKVVQAKEQPCMSSKEHKAELALRRVFHAGRVVIDYAPNERVGAALVLSQDHEVIDTGIKGDGSIAWARVKTEVGTIEIASIYASTKSICGPGWKTWSKVKGGSSSRITTTWNCPMIPRCRVVDQLSGEILTGR
ncbi:hypothetical protein R1sor_013143 [Riccia sorocarpa]|uniref:DUF4283 domain-containing protein n=1 Tax=Riccia sorocarpa TaxID=122646 RepID=A0ABD3H8I6_9MARC